MSDNQSSETVVSDLYDNYTETQKEILVIETRKTRNKLFTIGAVLLFFNVLAVIVAEIPLTEVLLQISLVPLIFLGLGLLSVKEPLAAMIIGFVVLFGLWIYNAVMIDSRTLLQGWLGKAIVIYLLFAGLQNAREAHRIKKELKL